ncbi:murein hydrolase activator EnvC [Glaciimonas sp. PAMC28666]|uniref:murein hydrolase activator EnvC family protein n=1 Tax=Glaciimonas sp. PAMC28666 TaxID=2807626 RepID=UPI0019638036|nr:peptidoglycan DD-metalloendopeptidase family protein [Glaciimonas sp. PAMC28666]QRX84829.1 peptidoglycan DD-metalloendopeptidase family protein [Glaciimonas sp. PAMC28666]
MTSAFAAPPKITDRSKQKEVAEGERDELQQKLNALKSDINQTETAKGDAADALADSEAAISKANRALFDLGNEQSQTQTALDALSKKHLELSKTVAVQQNQMAALLRQQYIAGNEDRIKLLLSGDNPNKINRELQYMGYVSKAQAKLIEALRVNLEAIEANQTDTQNAKNELDEIALEQRTQKTVLEKEKNTRALLLTQLSSKLIAQRQEVGKTARDEQRLAGLVDKLAVLIEEQKKAEAARREQRRQEQLAKAQAAAEAAALAKAQALAQRQAQVARAQELKQQRQRAALAQKQNAAQARDQDRAQAKGSPATKTPVFKPDPIDDDQPPPPVALAAIPAATAPIAPIVHNDETPEAGSQEAGFGKPFASLRGLLRLPVRGDLTNRFGSKRGDGPPSRGIFIRAAEGAQVKAVAAGRVIFADWLRGFGNLIILDHGNEYMTIYGNNQALLKRPGDLIKAGDVIANAGNSGGNEQSGLYFEIRHQGRAFDPISWVTIR